MRQIPKKFLKKMKKEGIKLYCPKPDEQNAVIQGMSFSYIVLGQYLNTKFSWVCAECGQAWFSREQATYCRKRGHKSSYYNSGDEFSNMGIMDLDEAFDYSMLPELEEKERKRLERKEKKILEKRKKVAKQKESGEFTDEDWEKVEIWIEMNQN